MIPADVVREYFPNANDDLAEHILWNHTGWPCFWLIPEDGNTPEECMRTQLQQLKDGKQIPDYDAMDEAIEGVSDGD